jgi:hypothetical protein
MSISLKPFLALSIVTMLSSCGTYSSKFSCADARGMPCRMLSEVDKMVDSGEIEKVYSKSKCRFGRCLEENNNRPPLELEAEIKAKLQEEEKAKVRIEGEHPYVK